LKAFAYVNATNDKEAVAALGTERNRILPMAGGMDLLGLMKDYIVSPDRIVSIRGLDQTIAGADPSTRDSRPDGPTAARSGQASGLRIGAATKIADVAEHALVRKMYPALATAAEGVGTPQIRNMGTVGGNIMQRPRCWYFRNEEFNCLKKGGSRCFAVEGENQFHAIFGDGPCHIVHPSSLAVPVIAYGGKFRVAGPSGSRDIDAGEFFQMPNANLYGESVLQPNEIITHVILPSAGQRSAGYEVRFKQSHDWPLAMVSVNLVMGGQTVKSARVVMGAVAPVPWRSPAAERVLAGKTITEAVAIEAANAALAGAKPMSGNAYKIRIAKTAVKRAILRAAGLAV
jgi:xanthine dehydrogenase YagS FAD-binding subunit